MIASRRQLNGLDWLRITGKWTASKKLLVTRLQRVAGVDRGDLADPSRLRCEPAMEFEFQDEELLERRHGEGSRVMVHGVHVCPV